MVNSSNNKNKKLKKLRKFLDFKFSNSQNSAFSLLEILIAISILSVSVVGVLKLNIASFFSSRQGLILSRKVELATSVIEKLASVSYDELEAACSEENGLVIIDNDIYYVSCNIISDNSNPFKLIIINVSSNWGSNYDISFYRISEG